MSLLPIHKPAIELGLFALDPEVVFLNHGSFGSCPRAVLAFQEALRMRLERQPVQFMVRELEPELDKARAILTSFIGAKPDDLVFISNATTGVNTILRSISLDAGDELLVTDHEYNACRNAIDFAAEKNGAKVVPVSIPFPISSEDSAIEAVLDKVTERTKLLLIDHVTSPTGLVLPLETLVSQLNDRGIDTLVDGAHAPGMIALDVEKIGAAYYTGNCHKWLCAPKGAGFLHVRPDRQKSIRPLSISHGANSLRTDRSRFQIEFAWTGTDDPTAFLSVPRAIQYLADLVPGGWSSIMERNRRLVLEARFILCQTLNQDEPSPASMVGSMASVPVADSNQSEPMPSPLYEDHWQGELMQRCRIEIPIIPWPAHPKRLVRMSAQLYNSMPQFDLLAEGIKELGDDEV